MNQKDPTHVGKQTLAIKNANPGSKRYADFPALAVFFPQQIWEQGCRTRQLTSQESAVARGLSSDTKQEALAKKLSISVSTLRCHTRHIYRKLQVGNRLGLTMVLNKEMHALMKAVRRSNAEKRKCVQTAFENIVDESDNHIAEICGVSQPFVSQMRRQAITVLDTADQPVEIDRNHPARKVHVCVNMAKRNGATGQVSVTITLRRTNADKRNCVVAALKESAQMANRTLAERCGVSDMLVASVRNGHQDQVQDSGTSENAGRTANKYPVKNMSAGVEVKSNGAALPGVEAKVLRRTNADKRNCVVAALKEFPDLSNRAIAERCAVSDMLVGDVRRQEHSD